MAVASLCLAERVAGVSVVAVEKQSAYAALARRNVEEARATARAAVQVVEADLTELPLALRQRSFDHVLMNPPYFHRHQGSPAPDVGRDMARGEQTGLAEWIEVATRRLGPGGTLSLIQRIERLPDVLAAIDRRLGGLQVLPIQPRASQPVGLFLLRARKGRRDAFQMRPPVVMHRGMRHGAADDGYSDTIEAALRCGKALAGFEN